MKKVSVLFVVCVFVVVIGFNSLAGANDCNKIPWGEQLTAVEEIQFSHSGDGISYYTVTKVEACGISKIEDTKVTYGFKDNRLFTTIVEIAKAQDVARVVSLMIDEYGLPDHKKVDGWDIYQWSNDLLKIKLKSQYSTDRIKIGMYYKPMM